jgi:hypothetical protein
LCVAFQSHRFAPVGCIELARSGRRCASIHRAGACPVSGRSPRTRGRFIALPRRSPWRRRRAGLRPRCGC